MSIRATRIAVYAFLVLNAASLSAAQVAASAPQPATPPSSAPPAAPASTWEPKDFVLAAGVVVTFVLGVWNALSTHRAGRRTMFINTVTSQRIKWIERLRQDVAAYAGLVYHWACTDIPEGEQQRNLQKDVDRLTHVIRLRLNPSGEHDQRIEALLREIPKHTENQPEVMRLLEELTLASQKLLKEEWEKVKRESKHGPLSARA